MKYNGLTQTGLVQPTPETDASFNGVLPAVYRAATVLIKNVEALRKSDWRDADRPPYGREGTPTTREPGTPFLASAIFMVDAIFTQPVHPGKTGTGRTFIRKVYRSRKQARADVFDYIERFYNPTRRHSTMGYVSPIDFEKAQEA